MGRLWKITVLAAGAALAAWFWNRSEEKSVKALPPPDDHPDPVEEAIDESFPASDPPSWAGR